MSPEFIAKLYRAFSRAATSTGPRAPAASEVDFKMLLEGSQDMIWQAKVKDGAHRYLYRSPSTVQVLGWTLEELDHLPMEVLYPPESLQAIADDVRKHLSGQLATTVMVEGICKNGSHIWLENKVRLLEKASDGELSVVIYMRDVTERKRLEDKLGKLALLDGLTGIDNRRAFDQAIDREWKRAARSGLPLSLLLFDVDHFKLFNDTYGHLVGDDCLQTLAKALRENVSRPGDVVARYGGEEFAVLLPETDAPGADNIANALCRQVAGLRIPHSASETGYVTVSGGVSTALERIGWTLNMPEGKMPEGLLQAADAALYRAKNEGRNRIATSLLPATANRNLSAA